MRLIKRLFNRGPMLDREIEKWLDKSLEVKLPSEIVAINFNLYEDGENNWTIEMIGASEFDENDEDWACNEVYNNREKAFSWKEKESWKTI